jgi:hypothetical protein
MAVDHEPVVSLKVLPGLQPSGSDHEANVEEIFDRAIAVVPPARISMSVGPSPQRLAPHALTLLADVMDAEDTIGSGRFVLLHDPAGHPGWRGTWRVVCYLRADVEEHMAADPLLPDVAWSWMTEAWGAHSVAFGDESGTVTCNQSRPFGEIGDRVPTADIEVRVSWTPQANADGLIDVEANVNAWLHVMAAATATAQE